MLALANAAPAVLVGESSILRTRMGEAARARAQTFSWDETLGRMLGYYRALTREGAL